MPISLVLAGLCTGCAGTLAVPMQVVNNRGVPADYDTTWDAVIQWFALTNNPISTIEKDSGIVATEQLIETGSALSCGEAGYGYEYRQPEVRLNVFVRELENGTTDVRVTVTGRVLRVGNIGATVGQSEWRTCYSRGTIERDMLDAVTRFVG